MEHRPMTPDTLTCPEHGQRTWWPTYWSADTPACWDCGQPVNRGPRGPFPCCTPDAEPHEHPRSWWRAPLASFME